MALGANLLSISGEISEAICQAGCILNTNALLRKAFRRWAIGLGRAAQALCEGCFDGAAIRPKKDLLESCLCQYLTWASSNHSKREARLKYIHCSTGLGRLRLAGLKTWF